MTERHFLTAVRRLLRDGATVGTIGPVREETVLFRATPSMGFPASDVGAVREGRAGGWPFEMEVAFLGLYGPSSPMPAFWTEPIVRNDDGASNLRDFLDLFGHPLVGLLYRILDTHRVDAAFRDGLLGPMPRAVLALAGHLGNPRAAGAVDWVRLIPMTGLLTLGTLSADGLARMVAGVLELRAEVREWAVRRVPVPDDQLFRLGQPGTGLGSGSVIGESVLDAAGAVRLILGPLPRESFEALLPGGALRAQLAALLDAVLRQPVTVLLDLLLAAEPADGSRLGAARLGRTLWPGTPGEVRLCPTGPVRD